jgi:hypothetical protein
LPSRPPTSYPVAMRRSPLRRLVVAVVLIGVGSCPWRAVGRVDAAALERDAEGPRLRVRIVGDASDPRIPFAREAIAFWNIELLRLGRRTHFDSATIRTDSIPDELLRAASGEAVFGFGRATSRLLDTLAREPADIVIALSRADLISFSVRWREGSRGVVGIRRSDIPPLSLPNTVGNVIAHEIGHVLGLDHNGDSTMLMCGRPAPCRPAVFASERARFFPLTAADDRWLRERWP